MEAKGVHRPGARPRVLSIYKDMKVKILGQDNYNCVRNHRGLYSCLLEQRLALTRVFISCGSMHVLVSCGEG
jgi:hypothetical protein